MAEETPKHWALDSIKSLGLPTVFVAVLLYLIVSAGKWAATDVIKPLVERQMTFIDTATKTLTDTQLTAAELHHGQAKGFDDLKRISEATVQLTADTKRIIDMIKDVQSLIIEGNSKKE